MVSMETVPTPRNKPINATCKRREQAAREPEGTGGPRRERRVRGSWAVEQNRRGRRLRGAGKGGPRGGATAPGREKGGLWRSERDKESRRGASVGRPAPQRPGGGLRTGTRAPRALALPLRNFKRSDVWQQMTDERKTLVSCQTSWRQRSSPFIRQKNWEADTVT